MVSRIIGRLREQFQSLSVGAKRPPVSCSDTTLCTTCAALDFKKMLRDGLPKERMVPLGTLLDIMEKSGHCAFCRLVADLIWQRWRLDDFPNADVLGTNCSVSARGSGTLVPKLDEKEEAHRLYIHASRPLDISDAQMTAQAALYLDIQLLEEDARKVARAKDLHGRRIKDKIDASLIKRWIKLCERAHGDACGNIRWKFGHEELPSFVRVVDVTRMALVYAGRNCRFVALSYVWGGPAEDYCTSMANEESRSRPYGLNESILPATIVDAIQVTRMIGERYLWIDALCIIQDSQEDKTAQIACMDRVYGRAALVIVAASGVSVRDGLPGVRAGSRILSQHIEYVQGLHLSIPFPPLSEVVGDSVWNTRGWTFQEALLSSRRLYFTKHQVYFECERDIWCEDLVAESKTLEGSFHQMRYSRGVVSPIVTYLNVEMDLSGYEGAIEQYTKRKLTVDSDILAAATALMNAMTRALQPPGTSSREAFRFGMWIRSLDLSLLWQPSFDSVHTRRIAHNGEPSYLPSWAWSGWKGAVLYGIESQMVDGAYASPHPLPAESLVTAWNLVNEDGTIVQLAVDRIPPSWTVEDPNDSESSPYKYVACKSDPSDAVLDFSPPKGTLIFRTHCVRLQVLRADDSILADPGKATAHTIFHILPVDQVAPHYAGRIILPVLTPSPTVLEFVVLSRCDSLRGLWDKSMWGDRFYGCMLHVMAVRRTQDDTRVSERVGMGVVVESAWVTCRAEERVVLLA